MTCSCGVENVAGSLFCGSCGSKLEPTGKSCPREGCGRTGLPAEAFYCPDCGSELEQYEEANIEQTVNSVEPDLAQESAASSPIATDYHYVGEVTDNSATDKSTANNIAVFIFVFIAIVLGIIVASSNNKKTESAIPIVEAPAVAPAAPAISYDAPASEAPAAPPATSAFSYDTPTAEAPAAPPAAEYPSSHSGSSEELKQRNQEEEQQRAMRQRQEAEERQRINEATELNGKYFGLNNNGQILLASVRVINNGIHITAIDGEVELVKVAENTFLNYSGYRCFFSNGVMTLQIPTGEIYLLNKR